MKQHIPCLLKGINQNSLSCSEADLLECHLPSENGVFDCVKKGSISLVNNGYRTVNQIRQIYSKIFRGLCKHFMYSTCKAYFTAKSAEQDGSFFSLSQNGVLGQFRRQKFYTLQKIQ